MSYEFDKAATIVTIKQLLADNAVILFMKGSPDRPQCGFSATAVKILKACGKPFAFVDILQEPEIRATLKEVTEWPTFPQLIVQGELVGGSDILSEMYEEGELQELLATVNETAVVDEGYESDKNA